MVNAKPQNDSARGGACFYRERDAEVVSDGSMPLIRAEMTSEGLKRVPKHVQPNPWMSLLPICERPLAQRWH
ncbi:hypothetical protein NPIL_59281 [Nephila pilipes]|uniref:Uncharacterized protein n=1 Tax=Nephila pilipes TaxID=299642 RepID=A0A8X6R2Y4_NEPPI|nr:hypothetical protein NPIL_59281 [Nephila pilipes]